MNEKKIEAYGALSTEYKGKPSVKADFAEPQVIAVADKEYGWGWYQFPSIGEWADGTLCLTYSAAPDAAESYGTPRPMMTSHDRGKTWTPHTGKWGVSGLLLPNGDRIGVLTPKPYKVADLHLPEPVGVLSSNYGNQKHVMYRVTDLPAKLQTIRIRRLKKGVENAFTEHAVVDDPQSLRYSLRDVFPIIWWGDLHLASDGSILAGIYPGYRLLGDGTIDPKGNVFFYRSTDDGRSWKLQGRILYQPDPKADPVGDKRGGFTEPTFEILADGSLLCVMRTTDGAGIGPMYSSRSKDMGKTWSKPKAFAPNGVLPKLLRLDNGVLVLASGRPGVQVRFCTDGNGQQWTDPFDLVPVTSDNVSADTCGYTSLLATGPDSFLIAYSHFKHQTSDGQLRKAILLREITVRRP
ncbi:MAG: exo-alpha-sialidase [Armatimonadetes bacterium]|nr:exo-alpha-sialidase [Armatimonadota bacterium]